MSRIAAVFPVALAGALVAGAAHAQDGRPARTEAPITRNVAYADLDLTREPDVRTLARRLHSAAADACREATAEDPGLAAYAAYGRCLSTSMDAAVRRINAPRLTAMTLATPADARGLRLAER